MPSDVNTDNNENGSENSGLPQIVILEQPSSKGLRFRYECERKYAATIFGVRSTVSRKSFPTIKFLNCKGPVRIVVSCVTKDPPFHPHPHSILGKIREVKNGVLDFIYETTDLALGFSYLGIKCIKKLDIGRALAVREQMGVDPFNTGFGLSHSSIDLFTVRLCIQAFLEGSTPGVYDVPIPPIVTDVINDRRCKSELEIVYITHDEASVFGGTEMCILCEKGDLDVHVVFYRDENNWTQTALLTSIGILKGVAIVFLVPRYIDLGIKEPVEVRIQLRKLASEDASNAVPFQYLPLASGEDNPLKRKRDEDIYTCEYLQEVLSKSKEEIYLSEDLNSCDPWNLPEQTNKAVDDFRELGMKPDFPVNDVYTELLINNLKNGNYLRNFQTSIKKDGKKKANFSQGSNMESPSSTDNASRSNYSNNTLDSDDWVYELLQTIEEDSNTQKIQEPEIVKEPEIKYITPDPMPITTNTVPEIPNCNDFIPYVVNNNQQEIDSLNIPNINQRLPSIPEHLPTNIDILNSLPQLQGITPPSHLMNEPHMQFAMNINGNQWNNVLHVTNQQPSVPANCQYFPMQEAHHPNVPVHNNLNEHSSNYAVSNGSCGMRTEPFNQDITWNQIQKETLNEFDPLYSART